MSFDMENFMNETQLRNNFIDEFKMCAYKDKDGFPNVYMDRVWSTIDKLDEKLKDRVLFWFVTEHLTLINKYKVTSKMRKGDATMKIEREEVVYTYETEEEGFNHQKLMESQGWLYIKNNLC
ncbi:hypothetical protein G7L40_20845 [Paenibacillus polymyxa]|uniref:Uncharacterized protein n=1 Tax=Paenibacillus polymyxa TaxID=1406 RepID=A0A378XYX6_PAEPO|nr:hypothetical protein [Paenibacillus polymyxa]MBE7896059.1 hypothetical protein [Paenibacillus polymyxa]MBG9765985.1 hypothetical protein [Paenibacillus polymyxa]MCC3256595.1 hypothetical protein [Paenibacillus polymyxa]QPK54918.1 hypothetical protein G7035_20895 [Paenibacillus polymyxa]QPK60007.1 hypothetical protein G7L40_20845 [Paenibacillus polymyxa]